MKITVLCGGRSPERDVSLSTGRMVASALRKRGHAVAFVDSTLDQPDDIAYCFTVEDKDNSSCAIMDTAPEGDFARDVFNDYFGKNVIEICKEADIVFNAMHGGAGEDGTLQAVLDLNGIRFTGSSAKGCMLSMDKNLTKQILSNYPDRVRMPKGVMLSKSEFISEGISDNVSALGLPLVVKPVSGGSSVGVSIVKDPLELESALKLAFRYEHRVLVEQYVSGREFSVGILGSIALPAIEIKPKEGFYDYKNKYQQGMTEEICPAHITAEESLKMQSMALAVFEGLSLSAYARVDFIMTGSGEVYCLEANTLPGMTPMSLLPQEAAADGIDFPALCQMIVEESLKKYDRADS